jgi:hypothetical protein
MAIRGGLTEFSVPELLQLLALQQKTGVLTLTHSKGRVHVLFFVRGRVLAAADRRRSGRHEFLAYLYHNQILTTPQIENVEDITRSTGQDLFTVILASGTMSRDRLTEEMRRYTQRMTDEITTWRGGNYDFAPCDDKSLPHHGVNLHINPEELVLESMRRADELATMKESMLAPELILARVDDAPGGPLPRECAVALKLIDSRRSIQEICRLSPLGDYLTYEAITELLGRQKIMIVDAEDARRAPGPRARKRPVAWSALIALLALLAGSSLLGLGLQPLLARSRSDAGWLPADVAARRQELRVAVRAEVERAASPSSSR